MQLTLTQVFYYVLLKIMTMTSYTVIYWVIIIYARGGYYTVIMVSFVFVLSLKMTLQKSWEDGLIFLWPKTQSDFKVSWQYILF